MGQRGKLVRIYVNEEDEFAGRPLYEAIVDRCRELKVAGAAAFRALEGFGEMAELHHAHLFGRSDLPILITIVERPDKAEAMLPLLQEMMSSGLIAVTDVEISVVANGSPTTLP